MRLTWDQDGQRFYETGVSNAILFVHPKKDETKKGVAWNGVTAINESPTGGEPSPFYANNGKYLNLSSKEEFGCSIEAYTYPDEWGVCDGSIVVAPGASIAQQTRRAFDLVYKTLLGNDEMETDYGSIYHFVWNCKASVSEKSFTSTNDTPEPNTFSWSITTTPTEIKTLIDGVKVKPTATMTVRSTDLTPDKLKELEDMIYGTDPASEGAQGTDARIPTPDELIAFLNTESSAG